MWLPYGQRPTISEPCRATPQPGACLALCQEMSLTVSQASSEAIHELQNELVFQNVLLGSIDDTVENREEAESEIRAEIKTLEKRLRDVKRSATSIPSSSTASTSRASDLAAFSPHTNSRSRENHSFQRPGKAAQGMLKCICPNFRTSHKLLQIGIFLEAILTFFQIIEAALSHLSIRCRQHPLLPSQQ